MSTKKEIQKDVDKMLDNIIDPLVQSVLQVNRSVADKTFTVADYLRSLKELFSIAVLEGIKKAELMDERLDDKLAETAAKQLEKQAIRDSLSQNMKGKTLAANMSMNNPLMKDGGPRYVTPDMIDPLTGKPYKQ